MKKQQFLHLIAFFGIIMMLQSCARNGNDFWEDTKSAGRHMGRGFRTLVGRDGHSRQICCRNDFECVEDESCYPEGDFQDCEYQESSFEQANYQEFGSNQQSDFIPLQDQANNEVAMADIMARQPRETPGERGSSVPGIDFFADPHTIPGLANIFRNIYFGYDSSLVKGQQNLQTIHAIADFLRKHPNVYIFVEGHTDERGPQAYNLALGSRRANGVRNMLLNEGVNPDNVFTISYGKERPVILERHEEGWAKNRRAEFKVYER